MPGERAAELLADIDAIVWEADPDTLRFTFVSERAAHVLGYAPTSLIGRTWGEFLHPEDEARARESCLEAVSRRARFELEYRRLSADGRAVWVHDRARVVAHSDGSARLRGVMLPSDDEPGRAAACGGERGAEPWGAYSKGARVELASLEHVRFLESLDRVNRIIQGARDLEQLTRDALDVVLEVFECDRAWLIYPCDPDAATWTVPMERTRAEYPGGFAQGIELPVEPEVAETFRLLREANGPVAFGPGEERPVPEVAAREFQVKTQLCVVVYPNVASPYVFGLHQCSYERRFTENERRLFQEVGRRLADALTSLSMVRSLRESERKLAEAEHIAGIGYWELDFASDRLSLSDEAYRLLGLPQEERSNDNYAPVNVWRRVIHPDDLEAVLDAVRRATEHGPRFDLEFRLVMPDGQERLVHSRGDVTWDAEGAPIRFFGFMQDITERRRAELALRESHALLRAVVEGTSDAIYVKDLEGRYLLINSSGGRTFGKRVDEVLGKNDLEIFPEEMARYIMASDRETLERGTPHTYEEVSTACGAPRTYLSTKEAYRDARGNVIGIIGISRDITDLKRLEEQFRQSQKMEAIGRLAGGVAHDFNNLLTVINGYTELVLTELSPEHSSRGLLQEIRKAGERASSLTRQLLAFSRRQVLHPEVVNVNALVAETLRLLVPLLGETIELCFEPDPSVGTVKVDPGQFEHAIVNLAVNARDAMPNGGTLTIETHALPASQGAAREAPPSRALIVVRDTGHGMDPSTAARVFEPFFTTKAPGKGTGLGLAMVYGFVKQSGGSVDLESVAGGGTVVRMYLPSTAESEPARSPSLAPEVPTGNETILLVEDEDAVRQLSKFVLEASGYTVLEARDGREALEVAERHPGQVDLLVSDLVMPKVSGQELAARLLASRPGLRVLFVSGYPNEEAASPAGLGPRAAFLHKPYSPAALSSRVRELLDVPQADAGS